MDASISVDDEAWDALADCEALAARALDAAAAEAGLEPALVAVSFTSDAEIAALNKVWRGKDKPTNVLSFPAPPAGPVPPGGLEFLGDIILAHGTIAREAAEQGKSLADHTAHLVIHGLLHLAGFDHEREDEARVMEAAEIRAMARLGLPDPYVIG